MSGKITYLLGAGASVDALPTVLEVPERFAIFLRILQKCIYQDESYNETIKKFINKGHEFYDALCNNTSFDSYARLLYKIKHIKEFELDFILFKQYIGLYFLFEQLPNKQIELLYEREIGEEILSIPSEIENKLEKEIDNRYPAFLSEFFDFKTDTLDSNVNIISWNIDSQLELAYKQYNKSISFDKIQEKLKIYPSKLVSANNAQIIKLNGTAGSHLENSGDKTSFFSRSYTDATKVYKSIAESFDFSSQLTPQFYFAWEKENPFKDAAINRAKRILSESNIIVIVGYSFQRPNIEIDKILFSHDNMYNKKYYFQVLEEDFITYREKLKILVPNIVHVGDKHIEYISSLREFYVPYNF